MHTIVELRELFQQHKIRIEESMGWYLRCNGDRWTMLDDVYYLNDKPVNKKEVIAYARKGSVAKRNPAFSKKMTPKEGYEHDSESIEVDDE
jgi:hypothetical protein